MKNIIDIKSFDKKTILNLFEQATKFKKNNTYFSQPLLDKTITHLFFEPSTRTLNSFELAAKKSGAITLSPNLQFSSLSKGESLLDTVNTFIAMGTDLLVIRHQDNGVMSFLCDHVHPAIPIINAGAGSNQHPTQALLDLFTIQEHKNDWANLKITIVGDTQHSRVARSLIDGLAIMGVNNINLVAPNEFLLKDERVNATEDLKTGITNADIVVCLRLQRERLKEKNNVDDIYASYCVTNDILSLAKPDAIVMHPGPLNRNLEISDDVADGKQSVILQQVTNGVAIRAACLSFCLQ